MVSSRGGGQSYEVDGVLVPAALAGHRGLELCNTVSGWDEPDGREYLTGYRELVVWARERGLIDAAPAAELAGADGAAVLERATRLRAALYAVFTGDGDDVAWATVAAEVEAAAAAARLVRREGSAAWVLPVGPELPLQAAAAAAAELLVQPEPISRCPGHHCGWLFLNGRGRRRWCSMAVCGNRAKVARHARREGGSR